MRRLVLICLLGVPLCAAAQQPSPGEYIYPVRDVPGLYSANFGEMRPDHFHAGVDIKTDGVEGKPLVAVADGYVSRISVSPSGYGRALYVTLNNGTTAVYGHISRFRDDIEEYVLRQRMARKEHRVDLWCTGDRFPVRQGEVIAYSGNSGGSYGPHLHYEVRDTRTQRTLNTVRLGLLPVRDNLPPRIVRVHYIETDTLQGVPVYAHPVTYEAVQRDSHVYALKRTVPMPVGRNGFFVVEVTDRRDGVSNTFGIYRLSVAADGETYFEYRMDGFTFDQSRYCNAAAWYPLQIRSRNEAIRTGVPVRACRDFYTVLKDRGALRVPAGERRRIRIEAEDDCGHVAHLEFEVEGRGRSFRAVADTTAVAVRSYREYRYRSDGFSATVPAGALYESLFAKPGCRGEVTTKHPEAVILSPRYRMFDPSTPLHREMTVTLRAEVPDSLRPRTVVASLDARGVLRSLGGRYDGGGVTVRTRRTGDLVLAADTVAPAVRPRFTPGGDLSAARGVSFVIGDRFSGIGSYTLRIDGAWMPCDYYPVQGVLRHLFVGEPDGRRHTMRLEVTDGCGNVTVWEGEYLR